MEIIRTTPCLELCPLFAKYYLMLWPQILPSRDIHIVSVKGTTKCFKAVVDYHKLLLQNERNVKKTDAQNSREE